MKILTLGLYIKLGTDYIYRQGCHSTCLRGAHSGLPQLFSCLASHLLDPLLVFVINSLSNISFNHSSLISVTITVSLKMILLQYMRLPNTVNCVK